MLCGEEDVERLSKVLEMFSRCRKKTQEDATRRRITLSGAKLKVAVLRSVVKGTCLNKFQRSGTMCSLYFPDKTLWISLPLKHTLHSDECVDDRLSLAIIAH